MVLFSATSKSVHLRVCVASLLIKYFSKNKTQHFFINSPPHILKEHVHFSGVEVALLHIKQIKKVKVGVAATNYDVCPMLKGQGSWGPNNKRASV